MTQQSWGSLLFDRPHVIYIYTQVITNMYFTLHFKPLALQCTWLKNRFDIIQQKRVSLTVHTSTPQTIHPLPSELLTSELPHLSAVEEVSDTEQSSDDFPQSLALHDVNYCVLHLHHGIRKFLHTQTHVHTCSTHKMHTHNHTNT